MESFGLEGKLMHAGKILRSRLLSRPGFESKLLCDLRQVSVLLSTDCLALKSKNYITVLLLLCRHFPLYI